MADSATPASAAQGSRWLRRAAWAVGGLALVWLLSWLALPPLLKWQLQKQAGAALGRVVTVDAVDFKPWSLELTVKGLRVANADGQGEQFSLRSLYMNAELQSLVRLTPVLDALRLEGPRLALRHKGGGQLDVDDVVQRLTTPSVADDTDEGPPARFALFNIELVDGSMTVVDDASGVEHELGQVHLAVPFLSNLASRRQVVTEPRLAFVLNGSAFDSSASSTPFADDHRTRARIAIPVLDLAPYLPYWPQAWPVRLESGQLHVDLTADFEQTDVPVVALAGRVAVSNLRLADRSLPGAARPLLVWDRLELGIQRAEPLQRRVALDDVTWRGLQVDLHRDADGSLALQRIAQAFAPPGQPAADASPTTPVAPARPWQLQLSRFELEGGAVRWADAAVAPAAAIELAALDLRASALAWPVIEPFPFELSARVGDTPMQLRGDATDRQARADFSLGQLPLAVAAPYLAQTLRPPLTGVLQAEGELTWQAAAPDRAAALGVLARSVELTGLRLGTDRQPLARLQRLAVADAQVDLLARRVDVGQVRVESPRLALARDAQGRLDASGWLKPAEPTRPSGAPGAPARPWALTLADVQLTGGSLRWQDAVPAEPVNLSIDALNLRVRNLQPLAERQPEMPLSLQARIGAEGARRADPGRLSIDGTLRLPAGDTGLNLTSQLRAERLPLHAVEPYVADRLNLELLHAEASYRGTLALSQSPAGVTVALAGDAALEELQAQTRAPAEDLLNWKSLQVRGLRVNMAPDRALQVAVSETVLSDWFARIIIDPEGRINLQGLVKPADGDASSPTAVAAAEAAAQAASASPANRPDIRIGPVSLVNGRVLFSDRFIRPNYSANLTELTGALSAFSSRASGPGMPAALADLSLKGRAEGTATLDVSGKLNPLATPLALDIKGAVRDLELPPLSPYSVKYAGHGIQRGKLSVDVAYKIEPDGQLAASNQIVLNQLSFGDRVEGSTAPNLPVKLAVALLADRNGVIDINLPVNGSLNDPQFRLAPLIFRLVFNLIGKAVTAPFALIANAFGGGEDASQVGFEPGRSSLSDEGRKQLDAVAQALQNRPALRLTVVGHSDLDTERTGLQRARLDALVLAEKRRSLARTGAAVPPDLAVRADEYPLLLREVYRRADVPKPRNLIGMAKDIPQAEMEALLLAAQPVNDDAVRELAVARGLAVKDYLASRQLAEDRMFLGAPLTARSGEGWRPRAELQLAPR